MKLTHSFAVFARHNSTKSSYGQRTARQKRAMPVRQHKEFRQDNRILSSTPTTATQYISGVRHMTPGDQYDAQELSIEHSPNFIRKHANATQNSDIFDELELNPIYEYKNTSLLSKFLSDLGQIRPARETNISRFHQRKVRHAINRARSFGNYSSFYRLDTSAYLSCEENHHLT